MPRKRYIWFPGAKYHITSRGNRKSFLFIDDEDRLKYLAILQETKEKYPFIIHAYCLMTTHIHLQIETLQVPPDKFMKQLNLLYAKYFNKKYDLTGHVFEKRFTRDILDSVLYELDSSKYIHLNPLQANMVNKLEDYPWSSYRAYALNEENPLVTKDHILSYFPEPKSTNYEKYIHTSDRDLSMFEFAKTPEIRQYDL